jgi:flagellar M-ring protein FliF
MQALFKNLLIGFGFLSLLFLVIRPLLSSLRIIHPAVGRETIVSLGGMPNLLAAGGQVQITSQMVDQQKLIETAKNDPYQVAQILQNWLKDDK